MNDDFDELDRAIFALPLAPVPTGLRRSILRATVYAVPPKAPFAMREIVMIGAIVAVAFWLALVTVFDPSIGSAMSSVLVTGTRYIAETSSLAWVAAGLLLAFLIGSPRWLTRRGLGRGGGPA